MPSTLSHLLSPMFSPQQSLGSVLALSRFETTAVGSCRGHLIFEAAAAWSLILTTVPGRRLPDCSEEGCSEDVGPRNKHHHYEQVDSKPPKIIDLVSQKLEESRRKQAHSEWAGPWALGLASAALPLSVDYPVLQQSYPLCLLQTCY